MGGDLLAKKQYIQKAIRKWRLKKLKRNFTVNHTTYMDIEENVVLPDISARTLDAFSQERRQKSIERWKAKKDRSHIKLLSQFLVMSMWLDNIVQLNLFMQYKELAESSNAANLRKRVNETLNDMRGERPNCKKSKKTRIKDAHAVLRNVPNCPHCLAKKFEYETYNLCCLDGDVCLATNDAPLIFQKLYTSSSLEANLFRTCIRTINNHFAFTSMGVHYDKALSKRNNGIYTFRVQGKIYHFIDDFFESKNLHLYFRDTDTEVANRLEACPQLTESLIEKILTVLQYNPY
ncbi:hypothetical protein STAS_18044, partial [Striga asiatica]